MRWNFSLLLKIFLLSIFVCLPSVLFVEEAFAANVAPVVTNISITGTPSTGQGLTGHYTYTDPDNDWAALGGAGNAYTQDLQSPGIKVDSSGNVYFGFAS